MLGGFILLLAPQNLTGKFQLGFVRVFRWPLSIGGDFALTANTEQQLADTVPRRKYNKLEIHANNLQAKLWQQEEEFKTLSDLYSKYNMWEGVDFALAKVITASNVKGPLNELTIDYRGNARLAKDQFVIGYNSIIGTIADTSAGTAHVRLFTNPKSRIPVKIGGLDIKMWLWGNGDNSARIPQVPTEHKIEVGNTVFASDAGTRFLHGPVMIGKVARCVKSRKDPLTWDITVKPACDIEKLENVAIIIMNPRK